MRLSRFTFLVFALSLHARPVLSAGAAISWDDCLDLGSTSRTFGCDTNLGTDIAIVWFQPMGGTEPIIGAEVRLQVGFSNDIMPSWWQLKGASACRDSSLRMFADFPGLSRCLTPWAAGAPFGFNYFPSVAVPGRMELWMVVAQPTGSGTVLDENLNYYAIRFTLDHEKSTGAGACGGCLDGTSIYLTEFKLDTVASDYVLPPLQQSSIAWQGGRVPVRSASWGAIKALYR